MLHVSFSASFENLFVHQDKRLVWFIPLHDLVDKDVNHFGKSIDLRVMWPREESVQKHV